MCDNDIFKLIFYVLCFIAGILLALCSIIKKH